MSLLWGKTTKAKKLLASSLSSGLLRPNLGTKKAGDDELPSSPRSYSTPVEVKKQEVPPPPLNMLIVLHCLGPKKLGPAFARGRLPSLSHGVQFD